MMLIELSALFGGTGGLAAASFLDRCRRNIRVAIITNMITKATEPTTAPAMVPADLEEPFSDSADIWSESEGSEDCVDVVDVSDVMVNSGGKGYKIPNPRDVWQSMCLYVS
ncbi:hypothetical protein PC116_g30576 [Phytophthora cactorum]|nr:hypothetical protein PC116_g30576 [Phytophthora cactorum]